MIRVGIVASVIIIVVASICFGFKKAARDHATRNAPPTNTSAPRDAGAPKSEPADK